MEVYTIGFTKKTAADFFGILKATGIQRLVDVRLNNTSQLAGFAKRDDLAFFLKELCNIEYQHTPFLAPTQEILDGWKKGKNWEEYERKFMELLVNRKIADQFEKDFFRTPTVFMCSEPTAEHCHRRLVLEHLQKKITDLKIIHI